MPSIAELTYAVTAAQDGAVSKGVSQLYSEQKQSITSRSSFRMPESEQVRFRGKSGAPPRKENHSIFFWVA